MIFSSSLESRIDRAFVKSGASDRELKQVSPVDDSSERAHARRVRMMARMTWPVMASTLVLVLGPAQVSGMIKSGLLLTMLGVVTWLNLPSFRVIQRARAEGVPDRFVSALGFALGLRLLAALMVTALLW
jgi:hypothetical protein